MSVASALRVLDAFHDRGQPMTLSELSRRTNIPLSSAHRIVSQLREWGALERDRQGLYHVGLRLWEVAAQAPRAFDLKRLVMPYMQDLYEAVHRSVHLAVRVDDRAVFIERFTSPSHHSDTPRLGVHYPLHATSVGLALLAHAPSDVQARILRGPLTTFSEWTITDPVALRRVLAEARRRGYVVSERAYNPDVVAIAAPIDDGREVIAAISLIIPTEQWSGGVYPEILRATARSVSRGIAARYRFESPSD